MKRYEVFRRGNDPQKDYAKYSVAVSELVSRIPTGDDYQWKRRGQKEWRTAISKPWLRDALLDRTLKVGEAFYAKRKGGTAVYVLLATEVVTIPDCPVSNATAAVKELWDDTYKAFLELGPGYEFVYMGGFVCRRIDNSFTWSQHAFSNAFDFRVRKAWEASDSIDVTATTKVVNAVKDQAAEALWLVSGHFYHAHLTGAPKQFGTPGCA